MPPNVTGSTGLFLAGAEVISSPPIVTKEPVCIQQGKSRERSQYPWDIVWRNVIAFLYLHIYTLYGFYLGFTHAKLATTLWAIAYGMSAGLGITAGAHRLWCHRAYKAKWPVRVLLAIFQTMAFQNHIYEWVRDHRVHHKFTDTDADPHNSKRGFFFSHIGWLMVRKHKDVLTKGKTVDMSDLEKDWVVVWQKKLYPIILPLFCFVIPTWVPCYFWGENVWYSWYVAGVFRYTISLNFTWLVNSAAHIWGTKPYDKTISSTENKTVSMIVLGEGWHNYHHTFPWDYKAAELGNYKLNYSTAFIDFCAWLGLAYDLKTASHELIRKRILRTGDGSRTVEHDHSSGTEDGSRTVEHDHSNDIWGWGDKDMTEEDRKVVDITHQKKGKTSDKYS